MTNQDAQIDPVEALKDIRTLLRVAAEIDDMERVQKHIAMVQEIIKKALAQPGPT
jgi:hypothetical protein